MPNQGKQGKQGKRQKPRLTPKKGTDTVQTNQSLQLARPSHSSLIRGTVAVPPFRLWRGRPHTGSTTVLPR